MSKNCCYTELFILFNPFSERKKVKADDNDYKMAITHRKALIDLFASFDQIAYD